jgi:hypothetical protein
MAPLDAALVDRFWEPASDYLVQPPLTADALHDAEATLGVVLPEDFAVLLQRQNGGRVSSEFSVFPCPTPTSWAKDHVPFEMCFGIGVGFGSITESPALNEEWGQPLELVLLCGDGHWWIALDYRDTRSGEPPVVWYDNEVREDIRLAPNFRAFVEGLRPGADTAS